VGCPPLTPLLGGRRPGLRDRLEELFDDVRLGAVSRCTDCMPCEDGRSIWVARGLKQPVALLSPSIEHFI
jgi:hypothetical protein